LIERLTIPPDWFVYTELLASVDRTREQQEWLKACYDPSRIVMRYDLIVGEDDLMAYVWEKSQPDLQELFSVSIPMAMRSSSVVSNLRFSAVNQLTNGVQLTVEWGEATLSDDELDFFVCNDIITKNWFIEDTKEVDLSTNVYSWIDYNATNDTSRFYTCWTLYDTDGDGISDGRETLLYGTSITNSDTDMDYMTDGEEINAGLNPNDASDAFEDPDGDGYPTLYEVKNGSDWNNEWNVPLPAWVISPDDYVDIGFVFQYFNFNSYSIIELEGGTYYENDINFNGKLFMLVAPDNDAVIDLEKNGRAFVFNHLEDRRAMISGVTIENGSLVDVAGICIADDVETSTDYMLDYAGNVTNSVVSLDGTNITESSAEFDEAERITSFTTVASGVDRRETNAFAFAYNEITGLTSLSCPDIGLHFLSCKLLGGL